MLQQQIKDGIKSAMMAKDTVRLDVLRGLSSAFTNELVAKGHTPQESLSDEDALAVITRTAKQRKDSIAQFTAAGRTDLADEDTAQLKILEEFLPQLMSRDEVTAFVETKRGEFDPAKRGMFMALIMRELKGKADGALVKEVVDRLN